MPFTHLCVPLSTMPLCLDGHCPQSGLDGDDLSHPFGYNFWPLVTQRPSPSSDSLLRGWSLVLKEPLCSSVVALKCKRSNAGNVDPPRSWVLPLGEKLCVQERALYLGSGLPLVSDIHGGLRWYAWAKGGLCITLPTLSSKLYSLKFIR